MPLQTAHLICRQAVFDAGITTRDVLRRLQQDSKSALLMGLPSVLLKPWLQACRSPNPDTALFFQIHFADISHAFGHWLEFLFKNTDEGDSGCGSPPLPRLFTLATGCLASRVDLQLPEQLAVLIQKLCGTELTVLENLDLPRADSPDDETDLQAQRFHPRLFCLAWYLAWRQQGLSQHEFHGVYRSLAIYFASAMRDGYVAYARLAHRSSTSRPRT